MSGSDWILVGVMLGLLVLAAFLAMSETSLTRINRVKAITLQEEGVPGADKLAKLVERPERVLNPVLLLVLICHLMIATLTGVLIERRFSGILGFVAGIAFEIVAVFVLAEAAPKTYAVQHTDRSALRVAPLVSAIAGFWPLRMLSRGLIGLSNAILPGKGLKEGPYVSEEELLALADVAVQEEVIEREERALIHSIIEFGDTVVREVMVPRPDMVALESGAAVGDAMEVAIAAGYSRIPVFEQNIDDITGIVYAKDMMRALRENGGGKVVRDLLRPAVYVPETKRVAELMREMQAEKFHMAIVVDEYGGTAGLVTLEDLIEELVGEIVDEFDVEEPLVEPLPGGDVRVNGRMPLDELNELLHADFPEGDWDTVAGLVFNLLGHIPTEGETVEYDNHRFRAEKVQGRRIGRVRISPVAATADVDAE